MNLAELKQNCYNSVITDVLGEELLVRRNPVMTMYRTPPANSKEEM